MPPVTKVTKENIIEKTYQILSEDGLESINARRIARELNCSVQPIFSNFNNMEDLINEVTNLVKQKCFDFLLSGSKDSDKPYKQVGINYIKFAQKEPNLFKLLFMSKVNLDPVHFMTSDRQFFGSVAEIIGQETKLSKELIKDFHEMMWFYTHGIATLIATGTSKINDEEIDRLLTNEFIALMQLQKFKISGKDKNIEKLEDIMK